MTEVDSRDACRLLYNSLIQDESDGVLLRARVQAAARRLGFVETDRENMTLAAAEMASNQLKHAHRRGLVQVWQQPGQTLDLVALDFGGGIDDPVQAAQDGFSTAHTLGKGLGSIARLSHEWGLYTQPRAPGPPRWHGTLVWARFRAVHAPKERLGQPHVRVGLFSRSLADDRYNGDRVYLKIDGQRLAWIHLDGLGHGLEAQETTDGLASAVALGVAPQRLLRQVDQTLASRRGAVGVAVTLDLARGSACLAGVGDMSAQIHSDESVSSLGFAPGILGKEHEEPVVADIACRRQCTIITASDGIRNRSVAGEFPGLVHQHPQVVAYLLGNVMGRATDDQSVCVATARAA
ncbi:MAG: hypothetical protein M0037_02760 [Betaproteobacteria bacterium]|nr:hypothetical protein [Betaproteobacteria bacterium]